MLQGVRQNIAKEVRQQHSVDPSESKKHVPPGCIEG